MVWPTWTIRDLWRWALLTFGLLIIIRGLFSENLRMRDSRTLRGLWLGKVVTKLWQIIYMRTLHVVIGVALINFALRFARESSK
jgi:hypothetical protein